MMSWSVFTIVVIAAATALLPTATTEVSYGKCSQCIQDNSQAWCEDINSLRNIDRRRKTERCGQLEAIRKSCKDDLANYYSTFTENEKKKSVSTVHLFSSRSISVSLPIGHAHTLEIEYEEVDKPFDLYYLVDVSGTMKKHLEEVAKQGSVLGERLTKLSAEYRIGFGTFIDKSRFPFEAPYLFRNELSLTSNISAFLDVINKTETMTNHDLPEASLEALVQVLACNQRIGWRNESTKLVIIATDGTYHIAGDAKLAGILAPNDLQCHTDNENNTYTHADVQDYPSINQVSWMLRNTGTFVVFAVTDDIAVFYDRLTKGVNDRFRNSVQRAYNSSLGNDTSSTLNIIEQRYNSITSELSLDHHFRNFKDPGNGISITYKYKCLNETETQGPHESIFCSNVTTGDKIQFSISITVNASICQDNSNKAYIEILRSGQTKGLEIHLQPACKCSCEDDEINGTGHNLCSEHGDLICGHCNCNAGYVGEDCSCQEENNTIKSCIDPAAPKESACHGRGTCYCGECICEDRYNGTYCEYDLALCFPDGNFSRDQHWCSNHGTCVNGICNQTCHFGYEGQFCECSNNNNENTNCKEPENNLTGRSGTICGNAGSQACVCTSDSNSRIQKKHCDCKMASSLFKGKYCESFENWGDTYNRFCSNNQISEMVQLMHKLQTGINLTQEDKLENFTCVIGNWGDQIYNEDHYSRCTIPEEESSCTLTYLYGYADASDECLHVITSPTLTICPSKDYIYIIAGVVATILLIGLITVIIWKCITAVQDEREFEKFSQDIKTVPWNEKTEMNPLFQPPVTHVTNPIYRNNRTSDIIRRPPSVILANRRSELTGFRRSAHFMAGLIDGRN